MTEIAVPAAIAALIEQHKGIRLDVGCGKQKQAGFVGMDIRPLPGVDIVHDVESYPWPLPDASVSIAVVSRLVEHLSPGDGLFHFMDELWRVMQPDANVAIVAPYGNSLGFLQDPTHRRPIVEATWAYFDPLEVVGRHPNGELAYGPNPLYAIYAPKPWARKSLNWNPIGNVEVVLVKRREDKSYGEQ